MSAREFKKGNWIADWEENGKRNRKRGFDTKGKALAFIQKRKAESDDDSPRTSISRKAKETSFQKLADLYVEKHLSKTESIKDKYIIDQICQKLGSLNLWKMSPSDVRTYMMELFETDYAIATIKKHLIYIKAVLNFGVKMELTLDNPAKIVNFIKEFKKCTVRDYVIDHAQFLELQKLFKKKPWYAQAIVKMLWHTGMRIGEICNLKWKSVDLQNGKIRLSASDTKESDSKNIGLEPEIIELLTPLKKQNDSKGSKSKDHVFGITKELPIGYKTFYSHWKSATKHTIFSDMHIHDSRHCFVTRKRREGYDPSTIMKQTGHKTDSMFKRYNQVSDDEVLQMSSFNAEKKQLIEPIIKQLMDTAKSNEIPISTIHTVIRKNM